MDLMELETLIAEWRSLSEDAERYICSSPDKTSGGRDGAGTIRVEENIEPTSGAGTEWVDPYLHPNCRSELTPLNLRATVDAR